MHERALFFPRFASSVVVEETRAIFLVSHFCFKQMRNSACCQKNGVVLPLHFLLSLNSSPRGHLFL